MACLCRGNRAGESGVTTEYQDRLILYHEDWLQGLPDQSRICCIDVDEEFVSDNANADRVVRTTAEFVRHLETRRIDFDPW
jgi:hypothetical protein